MKKLRGKLKLKITSMALALTLLASSAPIVAYAAESAEGVWKEDDTGIWYEYEDGTYPENQWMEIDEKWYLFGENGYATVGWKEISEKWYYFNEKGEMLTGFQEITKKTQDEDGNEKSEVEHYIFDKDGVMLKGWQKINDTDWAYFYLSGSNQGKMQEDNSHVAEALKGIDISVWQGDIDWEAVKNDGVQFAFVRLGHGTRKLDSRYAENMTEANAVEIPVGVYFYSTAKTPEDAVLDAQFVIDSLKGYTVSYPVAIDLEDSSQSESLTKAQISEIAKAFCDEIRKSGYTPMIYCNENWYRNYIDFDAVGEVERWIARYSGTYAEDIERDIWQGGSTARIDGIVGNVDIDFAFTDYSKIITPMTAAVDTYVKSTGVWKEDETGRWYSYLTGGYPVNEWVEIDGQMYWFNAEGYEEKKTGWVEVDKEWYYYDEEGNPHSGWLELDKTRYYMDESGKMLSGWQLVENTWYYLGASNDGSMKTGWQFLSNNWYYFDKEDGSMQSGWEYISDQWYYFGLPSDGSMKSGWQFVDNNWYYFGLPSDGSMKYGWEYISGSWYYFGATKNDGAMKTGWQYIDGLWYYMYEGGSMASSRWIDNYYVNSSGAWVQ